MTDIHLRFIDTSYFQIQCDQGILNEIADKFTFFVPGYRFMKKFKLKLWDGRISLVKRGTGVCSFGLLADVIKEAKKGQYSYSVDPKIFQCVKPPDDRDSITEFANNLKLIKPYELRDYQAVSVVESAYRKRIINVSATASGKSLAIYVLARFLLSKDTKILIVVPNVSLVEQLVTNFKEYAADGFDTDKMICKIYSGQERDLHKPIVVSTWQSIYQLPKSWFQPYSALICDEVHQFKSIATSNIVDSCSNASYKIGFTGTLDGSKTNEMSLRGLFGPPMKHTSTKDLMERNLIAKLKINTLVLKYDKALVPEHPKSYQEEMDLILDCEPRQDLIAKLACSLQGNTLILSTYVENGVDVLVEKIKKHPNLGKKKVLRITGGTDPVERERIRQFLEVETDCILVATYGVLSTGVSITNLQNLIFGSPTKSKIRSLQSIGRVLRAGKNKTHANLYDLVDDLSCGKKSKKNFFVKHFESRFENYTEEKFDVEVFEIPLKP